MSECPVCGGQIETDDILIDSGRRVVVRNRQIAIIPPKQFEIFDLLYSRLMRVVHRDAIMNHLYGLENDEPDWHVVMVMVHHLRKRIANLGFVIESVRPSSYLLKISDK